MSIFVKFSDLRNEKWKKVAKALVIRSNMGYNKLIEKTLKTRLERTNTYEKRLY